MSFSIGMDPVPDINRLTPERTHLRVLNGPGAGRTFPLAQAHTVLGRNTPGGEPVDVDLSECELGPVPMVSRKHAELEWVQGELRVTDLGSRNGTFVDGKRLEAAGPGQPPQSVVIVAGSRLMLANVELEVISAGPDDAAPDR